MGPCRNEGSTGTVLKGSGEQQQAALTAGQVGGRREGTGGGVGGGVSRGCAAPRNAFWSLNMVPDSCFGLKCLIVLSPPEKCREVYLSLQYARYSEG